MVCLHADRFVTVLRGTWYTGTDASWDPDVTVGLGPGAFMFHPAGAVHFDGAKADEVELHIMGIGPSGTNWLFPHLEQVGVPRKLD